MLGACFAAARTHGGVSKVFWSDQVNENDEVLSKEQRILRVLRKVLGNIVKDAAPRPGRPNPLQESTINDIRDLFGLIAEREAELADQAGLSRNEKPYFGDDKRASKVVTLHPTRKTGKPDTH
jgi:hypothetical protein